MGYGHELRSHLKKYLFSPHFIPTWKTLSVSLFPLRLYIIWAHNPKVVGSNPAPATSNTRELTIYLSLQWYQFFLSLYGFSHRLLLFPVSYILFPFLSVDPCGGLTPDPWHPTPNFPFLFSLPFLPPASNLQQPQAIHRPSSFPLTLDHLFLTSFSPSDFLIFCSSCLQFE